LTWDSRHGPLDNILELKKYCPYDYIQDNVFLGQGFPKVSLGEKLRFSTMVSTMFQLHFEVETSLLAINYFFQLKMTFSTTYQNS
jgi:hypothetical protein